MMHLYSMSLKSGHLTKQDTWNGPKGVRIRGAPLYIILWGDTLKGDSGL